MKQPFKTAQPVLFPPLADRAAWESLPGAARWAAAGQAALADAQTAPELPLSLWLQFTRSGDRAKWEHAYFARRRTLCALAMAEAVTNRGTYLPALADLAWRICEESAWQLPAHNSYIRDTPQLPLPDVTRPIVDLFAAETGALIATVCGLLDSIPGKLDDNGGAEADGMAGQIMGYINDPKGRLCAWNYPRIESYGIRLPADYSGPIPAPLELMDVPEGEYMVFEHGPFDYEQECRTVENKVETAMRDFDYAANGCVLDTATPGRMTYFYFVPGQYFKYIRPIRREK